MLSVLISPVMFLFILKPVLFIVVIVVPIFFSKFFIMSSKEIDRRNLILNKYLENQNLSFGQIAKEVKITK